MAGKGVIGSFLKLIIIAVVAYFVCYFFLPDFSNRFFGVSFRSTREANEARAVLEDMGLSSEQIDEVLNKGRRGAETVAENAEEGAQRVSEALSQAVEGFEMPELSSEDINKLLRVLKQ